MRVERHRRGLTQGELARRLGVAQQTLSAYETGRAEVPPDVAVLAARCLGGHLAAAYCSGCPMRAGVA